MLLSVKNNFILLNILAGKEAIILHADKGCGLQASTAEDAQISKGNKNDNSEYIMPENLPDEFAIKVCLHFCSFNFAPKKMKGMHFVFLRLL